jgi:PAS domain S-box-containing protein
MVVDHHIKRLNGEEVPVAYSFRILNEDGTVKWVEFNTAVIQWKGRPATLSFLNDVTARKQAESQREAALEALRESEELFRSYLEYAPDGVYINDMEGNFLYGNRKCEEIIGYRREELIGKNFVALNILSENSLNKAVLLLQANMKGKSTGPDEIDLISKEGRLIPVEINTNVVQRMGQRIVLAFVRNITERKLADEERAQSFEQMRKALRATVQSISITVEMRDPYTSGHQRRVSDLARSIAKEMGLSEDRQDFIFTASTIHDIGKIAIPAEILSKPTKLIDLEFNLIKTHSQSGYDILKDIEFPWPVADVVLQHHERMDGSGYPQGLKGDDILLEARILAIADVVEAITFHRPYRPAIGINLALEEISRNKGILYDADAVDACLKLFREKGYALVLKK